MTAKITVMFAGKGNSQRLESSEIEPEPAAEEMIVLPGE
jgi:hypothetical protein